MNEAPGPSEAHYRIPSVGAQGGNIFRSLRRANVKWAADFEEFIWPTKILTEYKYPSEREKDFELRERFLKIRANHITCSNAYPRWPKPSKSSTGCVNPAAPNVLSPQNIVRLNNEIHEKHRVLLMCGEFAWLACCGYPLDAPASHEGTSITNRLLDTINSRLSSKFEEGWYMGHTRRWSFIQPKISKILEGVFH